MRAPTGYGSAPAFVGQTQGPCAAVYFLSAVMRCRYLWSVP